MVTVRQLAAKALVEKLAEKLSEIKAKNLDCHLLMLWLPRQQRKRPRHYFMVWLYGSRS